MVFIFILVTWTFSLCLHELAHAATAYAGGDHTVREKGYLTLNPLKFTDPVYSLLLPLVFLLLGGFGLPGGAVYIERELLRSRAWDSLVSAAGPAANALLAIILAAPFYLGVFDAEEASAGWAAYAFLIQLQIMAVLFNLIPVPPFDGFGIIAPWFGEEFRNTVYRFSTYALLLVFAVFWYVEPVSRGFWGAVWGAGELLGVPQELGIAGLEAFLPR